MLKTLKTTLKRERGFTLIELLAVMSIVAVLAGIVSTSVSGTGESSRDAAARQDASSVHTSAGDFFGDQTGAQTLTSSTVSIVIAIGGEAAPIVATQVISTRWPETFITETLVAGDSPTTPYPIEFPTSSSVIDNLIVNDLDGDPITGTVLLTRYTAIDFDKLVGDENDLENTPGGYSQKAPESSEQTQTALGETFHNYLWLFKKSTSAGGSGEDDSRVVAVFKLTSIEVIGESEDKKVDLKYVQIQ